MQSAPIRLDRLYNMTSPAFGHISPLARGLISTCLRRATSRALHRAPAAGSLPAATHAAFDRDALARSDAAPTSREAAMASVPGAYIVTLAAPQNYSDAQLDVACQIAHLLNRGRFVLLEKPDNAKDYA